MTTIKDSYYKLDFANLIKCSFLETA